jgi:hypothetical protein
VVVCTDRSGQKTNEGDGYCNCQNTSGKAMPMFLSALLYSQKLHSDHESILQIFNPGILALILVKPEIFQLFFFSLYLNKTRLTNSTSLRNTCNSKQSRPTCAVRSRVNTGNQIFFQ